MKKAAVVFLVTLLLTSAIFTGCGGTLKSSGKLKTEKYDFDKFNRVEISNAFEFQIAQGNSYSINITADDNLFERIKVTKDGETLKIDLKNVSILGPLTLKAAITMPQLSDLKLSGATRGTVSNFKTTDDVNIILSGASRVELARISAGDVTFDISGASEATGDLAVKKLNFKVSGASSAQLSGSASDAAIEASGASRVKLAGLTVNNANVNLSGASTGAVNLNGRLDADITGASKLEYSGAPIMGNINTSGASTLSKK